jgi:hypothetical protein
MKTNQISQMTINEIQDSITLTAKLAKDNYDARNAMIDRLNATVVVDPRSKASYIAGECYHYFPLHNLQGDKINEVKLYCRCSPTVKGSIRYSYSVNGKVVALKNVFLKLVDLGV